MKHFVPTNTGKQLSHKGLNIFIVFPLFKNKLYLSHKEDFLRSTFASAIPQQHYPR